MVPLTKLSALSIYFLKLETDVKAEADRVKSGDIKQQATLEPLIVSELVKCYHKGKTEFTAVNKLSFGISPKECFGYTIN